MDPNGPYIIRLSLQNTCKILQRRHGFVFIFFDRGCHKNKGHRSVYLKRTQNNERVLKEQSNKAIHKIQAMKSDMGGQHRHGNKWIFLVEKHCLQPRLMRTHVYQQLWDQTCTQQQN